MPRKRVKLTYVEETREYVAVDETDGEIKISVKSDVELDSISLVTKIQRDYYDEHKDMFGKDVGRFQPFQSYGKLNLKAFAELSKKDFSSFEFKLIFYFISNVGLKNNAIKKNRKSYATIKDMMSIMGVSKSTLYSSISKMKSEEIIVVVSKNGKDVIYLNPYIFFKGNTIMKDTFLLFNESKWRYCKK